MNLKAESFQTKLDFFGFFLLLLQVSMRKGKRSK